MPRPFLPSPPLLLPLQNLASDLEALTNTSKRAARQRRRGVTDDRLEDIVDEDSVLPWVPPSEQRSPPQPKLATEAGNGVDPHLAPPGSAAHRHHHAHQGHQHQQQSGQHSSQLPDRMLSAPPASGGESARSSQAHLQHTSLPGVEHASVEPAAAAEAADDGGHSGRRLRLPFRRGKGRDGHGATASSGTTLANAAGTGKDHAPAANGGSLSPNPPATPSSLPGGARSSDEISLLAVEESRVSELEANVNVLLEQLAAQEHDLKEVLERRERLRSRVLEMQKHVHERDAIITQRLEKDRREIMTAIDSHVENMRSKLEQNRKALDDLHQEANQIREQAERATQRMNEEAQQLHVYLERLSQIEERVRIRTLNEYMCMATNYVGLGSGPGAQALLLAGVIAGFVIVLRIIF